MKQETSWTPSPADNLQLMLRRIWNVQGDPSYQVHQFIKKDPGTIAIRTVGGEGFIRIDQKRIPLHPESLILAESDQIQSYGCVGEQWDFWWFEFSVSGELPFPLHTCMDLPPARDEEIRFQQCFEWLQTDQPSRAAIASAEFSALLQCWRHLWQQKSKATKPHQRSIEGIIAKMRQHLETPLPMRQLAAESHLCPRRFRQVFRDLTGQSPKKFYDHLRLSHATELLRMGAMSIQQIAYRLGFSSPFHFSKAFKAQFAVPPSTYAKSVLTIPPKSG